VCGPRRQMEVAEAAVREAPEGQARVRAQIARRDLETCSADIRAGAAVREAIRGLAAPGAVWVHDLEADWIAEGAPLDGASFYDAFHFTIEGHATRTALTVDYLDRTPALRARLSPGSTSP
jgi:hypothetical protein